MIRPQSCTATILLTLTMPVSVSTSTSAICTPPTPLLVRSGGLLLSGFLPRTVSGMAPSLAQASFQLSERLESPLTLTIPFTHSSWSGCAFRAGATLAKQRIAGVHRCTTRGGTYPADGGGAPGAARRRIDRVADLKLNGVDREAKGFGGDDQDARASPSSEILRSHLHLHRAIRMDGEVAVAGVAASSPGVKRDTEAAHHVA